MKHHKLKILRTCCSASRITPLSYCRGEHECDLACSLEKQGKKAYFSPFPSSFALMTHYSENPQLPDMGWEGKKSENCITSPIKKQDQR